MIIDCLLHVHSSFSYDSKTDLPDIARVARREGIGCVLMSEHNNFMTPSSFAALVRRCEELSDDGLLVIPGLELAFDSNRIHLLAYGVRDFLSSTGDVSFGSLVRDIHRSGGIAVLAHPSHRQASSRLTAEELLELDGIEVWNIKNGNRFVPMIQDIELLKDVRQRAPRGIHAFGGLDWHHLERFTRIVLRVETAVRSRDAILQALAAGRFTIQCGRVSVPASGLLDASRIRLFDLAARSLVQGRRVGLRWQSRLERLGFKTPRLLAAAARRLF